MTADPTETRADRGAGSPLETRTAIRCSVCRRWLVDPVSIAAGAGPTCRGDDG
ncbi:DUF6011 domain-containing protein [Mycolicibacterium sp. lyk4-40-TYG-92]|uniref:DUF6011 domain-containing protein n=1 Tax=Mycolicibacterium sp. lyk4-40-TYG-92 TaxID=3040295 RepID=UPI0033069110